MSRRFNVAGLVISYFGRLGSRRVSQVRSCERPGRRSCDRVDTPRATRGIDLGDQSAVVRGRLFLFFLEKRRRKTRRWSCHVRKIGRCKRQPNLKLRREEYDRCHCALPSVLALSRVRRRRFIRWWRHRWRHDRCAECSRPQVHLHATAHRRSAAALPTTIVVHKAAHPLAPAGNHYFPRAHPIIPTIL